jgi:hypothetical protein
MTTDMDYKEKRRQRMMQKKRHISRQKTILTQQQTVWFTTGKPEQWHRLHKKNATNCGNPMCMFCTNPRRLYGNKKISRIMQEQRFF